MCVQNIRGATHSAPAFRMLLAGCFVHRISVCQNRLVSTRVPFVRCDELQGAVAMTAIVPSPAVPLVSVVIVNFNAGGLLVRCVQSVLDSTVPVEVIVCDNGSGDGSILSLRDAVHDRRLNIIENFANLGFARACNIGIERASGTYILLLNPDCVVGKRVLERVVDTLRTVPDAGMVGCLIKNPDGSEQAGCRRLVPTPGRSLVRALHLDRLIPSLRHHGLSLKDTPLPKSAVEVKAISGSFMLVTREALLDVGPLDERYFLHCEDLDWCMRFWAKGWKILFDPSVSIVHHKGACSRNRRVRVEWYKHKGMVRFYRRFFRQSYPTWLFFLVVTGIWLRFSGIVAGQVVQRLFR